MSIQAKVHAPTATLIERSLVYSLAGVLFALGLAALNTFPFAYELLSAGFWIWLVSPLLLRRPRGTRAHIECDGGKIHVRPDRMPPRTIETRKLAGASVARTGDAAVVTLSERGSRNPISIEVKTAEEANQIRAALGIPHGGFGQITWCLEPRTVDVTVAFMRNVAAFALLLSFVLLAFSATWSSFFMALGFALGVIPSIGALGSLFTHHHVLRMNESGIFVRAASTEGITFANIEGISDDGNALMIRETESRGGMIVRCAPTRLDSGLSAEERALMVAQLQGAVAASKGEGAPFVDPTSHLDALKRRANDASVTDWLTRLDALAQLHDNAAYRSTSIAKEDLWRALESHDAARDVRAG
ncbi:MAG: hypothetical protein ACREJX_02275, partial [Polyangiaceae bacterium]